MVSRQPAQNAPVRWVLPIRQDSELLASSFHGLLRDSGRGQNAYIMRTKCDHFHICEFFNVNASTTYNFNPLRCTHSQTALPFLPVDNQNLLSESHNIRLDEAVPFSLGQGRRSLSVKMRIQNSVRLRDRLVLWIFWILYKTRQNGTNLDSFQNTTRCTKYLQQRRPRSSHFQKQESARASSIETQDSATEFVEFVSIHAFQSPERTGIFRNPVNTC